ncbi:3-hydroxybutyryl-CoA dehydrogenase [Geodia barretti]|uniref:3-hydroxybutyryl-CoA dehydrogenase n=1 Tax=Geodia barretti TaxID=519541 RepID=A0AA35STI4_GEOBA|nr:3-hydroxybutyryl-CoA dehydrogenase [Geodia barretti]
MDIGTIGVIGIGTMGSGIVEVAARNGLRVVAQEASPDLVEAGRSRVEGSMDRGVARGKLDEATRDAASAAVTWTTDLGDLAGCDSGAGGRAEILALKLEIFGVLDRVLDPSAIMATNTSSIPIIDVAMGTTRPQQVLGMHFFNPATVMKLVEVISTQLTAPEVTEAATAFAADTLGKRVVAAPDRAGFVVNKLLVPYICQAIEMYESGHASAADIDDAMNWGPGTRWGRSPSPTSSGSTCACSRPSRCTRSTRSGSTRRRRCCAAWSPRAAWAARPAAASTSTEPAGRGSAPRPRRHGPRRPL